MRTIFLFDVKSYFKKWSFYAMLFIIVILGFFAGGNAHFSISENIFQNSPYQISFITAFLSLTTIFFSTLFASQLLFKEADARFELIIFSTPISKIKFICGRYTALFILSFFGLFLLTISFFIGQSAIKSTEKVTSFDWLFYAWPVIIFEIINTLFITSFFCFVGWFSRNKLLVYVSGLLLYIFYMVTLIYSGSPLMAQSLPQSDQAKFISAIVDPFGFSAFFYQTSGWSVLQRNTQLVSMSGIFLLNRLLVLSISIGLIIISARKFSFIKKMKHKRKNAIVRPSKSQNIPVYKNAKTSHSFNATIKSIFSFTKIDLIYITKSIPFIITAIALLFAVGMEMYAEIEKGIRIPQKYASPGLMVSTILQNFYGLCTIVVLYYAFDIFWRSKNAHFFLIESTTANFKYSFFAKWLSLSIVIVVFSLLMITEGVAFQLLYDYPRIDWTIYSLVLLVGTMPLILLGGLLLLIQKIVNNKYIGLGSIVIFTLLMTTTLGKTIITLPFLKFLHPINFNYSDMNGFGAYLPALTWRLIFGIGITGMLVLIFNLAKNKWLRWPPIVAIVLFGFVAIFSGEKTMDGYKPKNEQAGLQAQANYEKLNRKYQNMPTPTITDVITQVDLYPEKNAYNIRATYLMENKTAESIHQILINFSDDFTIDKAVLINGGKSILINNQYQLIELEHPILPNGQAKLEFEISYSWKAVNGHKSFNAIVQNGSFMRISRFYPSFGYLTGNEIQDEFQRKKFNLGKATSIKPLDAPKEPNNDFINLDMTVSTSTNQTAIGVGELTRHWTKSDRHYFQYKTSSPIPFRFALSSAEYAVKKEMYQGKSFEIYYHPDHSENVPHLLRNAKLTMDYCESDFGPYPFKTIRFAEVSGFTKGFAATAYPATIYMTEDMIFHSNLKGGTQQGVISELAGHELSHVWWGSNQISPDEREGSTMLTETLAMYTEMMLLKKMYGKEKMMERIKMHLGIYLNERGFTEEEPLYKVKPEDIHISYSKGAAVMYQLSEMIGEDKVNLALRNFLAKNKYPNPKPVSTDFINELYLVTDVKFHPKIGEMFMEITDLII